MNTRLIRFIALMAMISSVLAGIQSAVTPSPVEAQTAVNGPADTDPEFTVCGRVFSDPHAYWPSPTQAPAKSPFAKGNAACAQTDFLAYGDMITGMEYLESLYPDFVDFQKLEEDYGLGRDCATTTDADALCSAGLPTLGADGLDRTRSDLYMVRLTDERVTTDKKLFTFPLSIHGIERAGAEAGVRVAEDLAVWGYCEALANGTLADNGLTNCSQEDFDADPLTPFEHPLMETLGSSVTAGDALAQSEIYLVFANPDGWRRGDAENGPRSFQRYNGNGVDMNRDWPTEGYTFRPYTPWSEPETKAFGQAMQSISDTWDGGIDLHGQNDARAFSFTLMGASQRDYAKNQRILQTVTGAYQDAENRLAWSSLIKPNDADQTDPRLYGVQWGTVWDTIDYTVTGSLGDWIDSPIGLGADGIDNEMSFSHLYNCGTGTCYVLENEQLHVDGNKSLIYAMVNFTLLPEDDHFEVPGDKVGYVLDNTVLSDAGAPPPPDYTGFDQQPGENGIQLDASNNWTHGFTVLGPDDGFYNGGIVGTATTFNAGGVSGGSVNSLIIEKYRGAESDPDALSSSCGNDDDWQTVNEYFNQSVIYAQGGQAVHANSPLPGPWRICLTGDEVNVVTAPIAELDIDFTPEAAWADPGQVAYDDVTNMNFFTELGQYMDAGQLEAIDPDALLYGGLDLSQYTSIVIADDALPGFVEPAATGPAQPSPAGSPYSNPGLATAPCAYQRGITDVPGTIEPTPGCAATIEFDVEDAYNNQKLTVALDVANEGVNDWDLYVDVQDPVSGQWFEAGRSASGSGDETVTLLTPPPGHYRALVVNWSSTPAYTPQTLSIDFDNTPTGPPPGPSDRTESERDAWGAALEAYVANGGNLVLTDGALKNLAYMGLINRPAIVNFSVYAGNIGFTTDGTDDTYADPLAYNVNQPGAAEGTGHRHQTYEPVPIGYAIQDDAGNDFNSSPVWSVSKASWEGAGGRVAGVTGPGRVTLGELAHGNGVVRIIGPLLPMPSQQYYHPYGLADYALTYTGYQVLNNALQWGRPNNDPTAEDDAAETDIDTDVNIPVLANDSDPDNDPLTVIEVGGMAIAAGETVSLGSSGASVTLDSNGILTYDPAPEFEGTHIFTYTISDGRGGEGGAAVTVTVVEGGGQDTCRNTLCENGDKPDELALTFTGGDCGASDNSQGDKAECWDFQDIPEDQAVFIRATSKEDADYDNAKVWFEGTVNPGEAFTLMASEEDEDDFGSKVFIHIFDAEDGTLLQTVEIHTSCSVPLVDGEQFGSLSLGDPNTDPSDPVCSDGEGRVHGSGHWERNSGDKYDEVDFSFDAKHYKGALKGKLKVKDKDLDFQIYAKTITSLSTGEGFDCDGEILNGLNSFVFTATGEFQLGDAEGVGEYIACGIDNGKDKDRPADYFHVACTKVCSYETGIRTGHDNEIDGGKVHIHDPIVNPVDDGQAESSSAGGDSAPASGGPSVPSGEAEGEPDTIELDPILLSTVPAGTPLLLTATVETTTGLLANDSVVLRWQTASGLSGELTSVTNALGVATFVVTVPAGDVDYTVWAGDLDSNGVRITGT